MKTKSFSLKILLILSFFFICLWSSAFYLSSYYNGFSLLDSSKEKTASVASSSPKETNITKLTSTETNPDLQQATDAFDNKDFKNAIKFYEKYLEKNPKDLKARTDLALAYLQISEAETAIKILEENKIEQENFFPTLLSLALAHKVMGENEKSLFHAELALKNAPDEKGASVAKSFISSIKSQELSTDKVAALRFYIESHPILSSKLLEISWEDPLNAKVILEDFPINQMPPFAKEKLISKLKELIKTSSKQNESAWSLDLIDRTSGQVLNVKLDS